MHKNFLINEKDDIIEKSSLRKEIINDNFSFNNSLVKEKEFNLFEKDKYIPICNSNDIKNNDNLIDEIIIKQDKQQSSSAENHNKKKNIKNSNRILRTFKNISDPLSEGEGGEEIEKVKFIIHQHTMYKFVWDSMVLFLFFYSIILYPICLCFSIKNSFLFIFQIFLILVFSIDLLQNFFTTYYDHDENLIKNFRKIRQNYLKGFFIIDILSIFVSYFILFILKESEFEQNFIKTFIFIIIICINSTRLIKLQHYTKIGNLFSKFKFFKDNRIHRIVKSFLLLFLIIHSISCLFVLIGNCYLFGTNNWIDNNGFRDLSNFDIYIASFYYNLVTICTIGYGDIAIKNDLEIIYTILLLIFGVMSYTFFVSSISELYKKEKMINYKDKIKILDEIDSMYKLPRELYSRIYQSLKNNYRHNINDYFSFIEALPTHIQNEMIIMIKEYRLKEMNFFKTTPNTFMINCLPYMKIQKFKKGEIIYSVGDLVEEMYFVLNGRLSLFHKEKDKYFEVGKIRKNYHFGDMFLLFDESTPFELRCTSKEANVFILKKIDFLKIKALFNGVILMNLKESFKIYESFVNKKKMIEKLNEFDKSIKIINKNIRKLNNYVLKIGFMDYYTNFNEFQDPINILYKNNRQNLIKILDSFNKHKKVFSNLKSRTPIIKKSRFSENPKFSNNLKIISNLCLTNPSEELKSIHFHDFTTSNLNSENKITNNRNINLKIDQNLLENQLEIKMTTNKNLINDTEVKNKNLSKNEKSKKKLSFRLQNLQKEINNKNMKNIHLIEEEKNLEIISRKLLIKDNLTQISKSKSNLQTNYNSEVDLKNKNNLTENNIFTNLIKESSIKTFSQNLEIVLTSEFSLFSIYDTILNNLKSINNDKNPLENSDTNLVSNAILKNKIFKKCNFTNIDKRNQIINMIS